MKEKLENIKLLLQSDRRVWAGAGFIGVCLLLVLLSTDTGKPRRRVSVEPPKADTTRLDKQEGYRDLILALKDDVESLANVISSNKEDIQRMRTEREKEKERELAIFDNIVDRIEIFDRSLQEVQQKQDEMGDQGVVPATTTEPSMEPISMDNLKPFGFEDPGPPPPPPPAEPKRSRMSVITAGDAVPVRLITGVAAPVDGTPYPALFKLTGPITGPDGSTLDLGEARLIAAAHGSETDSRVLYRLTDLALTHRDGRRSVVRIDGWVIGEDGIRGMKGKLVDRLPEVLSAVAAAGFSGALAQRLDQQNQNFNINDAQGVTINSDDLENATASMISDTVNQVNSIILDRYEQMVPVVEVNSNRSVVAVFSRSVEVEEITDEYSEEIYTASLLD